MEIRVLRYFLTVARLQNISKAAQSLHLTQPTLSRQLMDLERELGKQLLIRGSRKVTLTDEGLYLRKRAEEIIDLVDKAEAAFVSSSDIVSGDVFIGCGETDAMHMVARAAKELQEDYPGIRYHLYSGNAEDVTEKLNKGLLDFGLLINFGSLAEYESLRLPLSDVWGVLMRKDSVLAQKERICAEDLWNLPLICSRQAMNKNEMAAWMKRDADQLNLVATYNLIYNAALLVEEGMGYALTLDKLVKTPSDSMLCFRPLYPRFEVPLDLVWKKHQLFSKAAKLFLKKINQTVRA